METLPCPSVKELEVNGEDASLSGADWKMLPDNFWDRLHKAFPNLQTIDVNMRISVRFENPHLRRRAAQFREITEAATSFFAQF